MGVRKLYTWYEVVFYNGFSLIYKDKSLNLGLLKRANRNPVTGLYNRTVKNIYS